MADDRHFKNRCDVIIVVDDPIPMKFGTPTQNHMPMTVKMSKSKPEIELQYVSRLFSETGSSNISVPIALDLLKCATTPNRKPEVNLRLYGRHLAKSI